MPPMPAASPLDRFRRGILLGITGVATLSSLLSGLMAGRSPGINTPDQLAILLSAVVFGVLFAGLWRGWVGTRVVEYIGLGFMAAYQLGSLGYRGWTGTLVSSGLGDGAAWFPIFFPLTFLILPTREALRASLAFFGSAVVIAAAGFGAEALRGAFNVALINPVGQFFLSNLVLLGMIYLFARSQQEFGVMQRMAYTDALTGLPNRRAMQAALERETKRSRHPSFAVIAGDVDHFKRVNDRHGHAAGDQALREIALRLGSALRGGDRVCRWGGEEFLILAPDAGLPGAEQLARRLAEEVRKSPVLGEVPVTLSLGVACWRQGDTLDALLARADAALYRAKAGGRDRVALETDTAQEPPVLAGR